MNAIKKRKGSIQLGAVSQAYEGVTPAHHYSFKEGFPLFTWLPKLETVAHPLLKAVLHVPYVRAAVPFPNHKWLGHVCTDRYISCAYTRSHLCFNLWMVGWCEGRTLMDAVHRLCLKSTRANWYAPRVQSTWVKYVALIFINFLVVVICLMYWCVTKRDRDMTVLKSFLFCAWKITLYSSSKMSRITNIHLSLKHSCCLRQRSSWDDS